MDEFAALAQRVVLTMDDVRGCLVLSRDGLVLGAFPEEQEAELKPAWLRFVHVGEARKGFVEFSDQLWAFVHRGPYAAFVVTGTSVRPGVMLDQLEQAVIAAEETRAKQKEVTLKVPDAAGAPSGRPRTSLHPPADRPAAAPVGAIPAAEEMPSFAAPTGPAEGSGETQEWAGADPAQLQQMQAMQEQMAAMQEQLQQQALQQGAGTTAPVAPAPGDPGAPRSRSSRVAAGRGAGVAAAAQWLPPTRVFRAGDGRDAGLRAASRAPGRAGRSRGTSSRTRRRPSVDRGVAVRVGARRRATGAVRVGELPLRAARVRAGRRGRRARRGPAGAGGIHGGSAGAARGRRRGARHRRPPTRTRALSGASRSGWSRRATAHLPPTSRRSPARSTASCSPRSSRGCFSWMGTVTKTSS